MECAGRIHATAERVHLIVLTELHPQHQLPLDKLLATQNLNLAMCGWLCGDALIWRPWQVVEPDSLLAVARK